MKCLLLQEMTDILHLVSVFWEDFEKWSHSFRSCP